MDFSDQFIYTEQTHGRRNFQYRCFVLDIDHGRPRRWLLATESARQQIDCSIWPQFASKCQNVSCCGALSRSLVIVNRHFVALGKHGFPIFFPDRQ